MEADEAEGGRVCSSRVQAREEIEGRGGDRRHLTQIVAVYWCGPLRMEIVRFGPARKNKAESIANPRPLRGKTNDEVTRRGGFYGLVSCSSPQRRKAVVSLPLPRTCAMWAMGPVELLFGVNYMCFE